MTLVQSYGTYGRQVDRGVTKQLPNCVAGSLGETTTLNPTTFYPVSASTSLLILPRNTRPANPSRPWLLSDGSHGLGPWREPLFVVLDIPRYINIA